MRRFAAIGLLIAAVGSTALADPVLDQSNDPTPTAAAGPGSSNLVDWAQTFTVGVTGTLTSVEVRVFRTSGVTDPLLFDIRTTTGGAPTEADAGANILSSFSIAAAVVSLGSVLGDGVFVSIAVSVPVTAGDVLAIVLRSDAPGGSFAPYFWDGTSAGSYGGGAAYLRFGAGMFGVSTFLSDLSFKTFVDSMRTGDQTVPEPSLLLLLATGAGLVACRRARRAA